MKVIVHDASVLIDLVVAMNKIWTQIEGFDESG